MATNAQRISDLEKWRTEHKALHATGLPHTHPEYAPVGHTHGTSPPPPPPAPGAPILDTQRDGWGLWKPYNVADYGLDSDFIDGQVQDLLNPRPAGTFSGRRITAKRQQSGTYAYVSGWLDTFGTFDMLRGSIEARLRWDVVGKGIWPAFWLLPRGARNPYPEIDILEAYPGDPNVAGPNVIVSAVHYGGEPADANARPDQWEAIDLGFNPGAYEKLPDGMPDRTKPIFHNYRMDWTAAAIDFLVDGVKKASITKNLPTVPMYPILSLAMGAPGYRVDANTPATVTMDCEWVRAW